jgi:hypothetical protein
MKKILLIIGGIIVVLIIIGVAAGGKSNQPTKVGESSGQKTEQPKVAEFKVGEVIKLGDREFIVNNVKRTQSIGQYQSAKSGKEYVIVNVTITNKGTGEVTYNPFDFKIQNSDGAQENQTFAVLDDSLNAGTLVAGGKVTGSIPFEVKASDPGLKLIFQPSFWTSEKIIVKL